MIRRLRLGPTAGALANGGTGSVRLLAVSDERVPALDDARNRVALGRIDGVVGCGDLEPDYLCFLADAFRAPLFYVRGNHDRGAAWATGEGALPGTLDGRIESVGGVRLLGFSWPGPAEGPARREESGAWRQALGAFRRTGFGRRAPHVVLSHVPPSGLGDVPADPFHRGFGAYHWLCRTLKPRLWLHGHTASAAAEHWRTTHGRTTLVNVTGAVLIELGAEVTAEQLAPGEAGNGDGVDVATVDVGTITARGPADPDELPADPEGVRADIESPTDTERAGRAPARTPPARTRPAPAQTAGTTRKMP